MTFWGSARLRAALLLFCLADAAHAAGTPANTAISNTATASYTDTNGVAQTVNSNAAVIRVDEILDVTVVVNDAGNVTVASPDFDSPLSFTVTNVGNGVEQFNLTADDTLGGDQFNPSNTRIFPDDGNGVFDGGDVQSASVTLNPDQARIVFVVSDIPGTAVDGDVGLVSLTAVAATGTGVPGTTFAGQGTGGTDAVVGAGGADATQQNGHAVSQVATTLTKTQAVADPFGGSNAVPGATITYTLTFTANGLGTITGVLIADAIPASTNYVAGSLTLDGAGLSDAADADAGRFTGAQIEVNLGTVTAPATRNMTFQVIVN